ncbi:YaaL family protein [Thermaerobacter composti]|uniref:YaaL family protein n=1 Tax=Thermaerobacter composti TaxID=554949 RepID=A0ABZ0QPF5_9FIRM|nr:YaaL family protein [Thermaerobacter composti]WPD19129.1 YaaL family protein [Thermaerobacter composti]
MRVEWGRIWRRRWPLRWRRPATRDGDEPASRGRAPARILAADPGRPGPTTAPWPQQGRVPGAAGAPEAVSPASATAAEPAGPADGDFDWVAAIDQARRDWEQARRYFECVTDRDLVDQAIHLVLAAEKRYAYLLKQARLRGIRGLPPRPDADDGRRAVP